MVNNLWDLEKVIQSYIIQSLQLTGNTIYEKLKEKVSLYVYKKEISLKEFEEGTVVKKEDEVKGPITASAIKSGFDGFTPSEVPKDDTTTETSTYSNNTLNNGSSSNNYYVEEKPSSNNSCNFYFMFSWSAICVCSS